MLKITLVNLPGILFLMHPTHWITAKPSNPLIN